MPSCIENYEEFESSIGAILKGTKFTTIWFDIHIGELEMLLNMLLNRL